MVLFVCETNAQLLNAINIKFNMISHESADVLLCCTNNKIRNLESRVKACGIFDNVYSFEIDNYSDQTLVSMSKKIIRNFTSVQKVGKLLPNKNKEYDEIFIAGPGIKCISVYYYFKNKDSSIKLNLFEEGLFEYYVFKSTKNKLRRPYSKLVYGRYYLDDCSALYVYQPDLVSSYPKSIKVIAITPINYNENLKELLNKIFNYKDEDLNIIQDCECLYIEQQFPTEIENLRQRDIISRISKNYKDGKFVVKLHPLSNEQKYNDLNIPCIKSANTMEMLYLNGFKGDVKLYSICSTAVFSPYLMFNYTPELVLLYKLFDRITIEDEMIKTIERFIHKYPNGRAQVLNDIGGIKGD